MKATQRFTETECDAVYELYSYMVDVSFPHYTYQEPVPALARINHKHMEKLAMDAGRVVLDVLQGYHLKPKRSESKKVIPLKRRTV